MATASMKRASVCLSHTPAVRASIPIPTRAPCRRRSSPRTPTPARIRSLSHRARIRRLRRLHDLSPASASASASASRPSPALSRASRTRAPPKTPLPTDALSTPWSGDWTAYAPLARLRLLPRSISYDSNSARKVAKPGERRYGSQIRALLRIQPAAVVPI
ncbi:hypothetical protein B0H14DRAFT_2828388, partial [Mycena olivaceomarginata]